MLVDVQQGRMSWLIRSLTGTNMTKKLKHGAFVDLKNNQNKQAVKIVNVVTGPGGDALCLVNKIVEMALFFD